MKFIPVVVVSMYSCLVHLTDCSTALIYGRRVCRIIIFTLTPCTSSRHFTVNALLSALSAAIKSQKRTKFIFINSIIHVPNNPCLSIRRQRQMCIRDRGRSYPQHRQQASFRHHTNSDFAARNPVICLQTR